MADSLFVDGYLTTPGLTHEAVWKMIEDLGFTIEVDYQGSQQASTEACSA